MNRSLLVQSAMVLAAFSFPVLASADTRPIVAGSTDVALDSSFLSALTSLGVTPSIEKPATLTGATAAFPVTDGEIDLDTAKAEIFHEGGLSLTAGSTTVKVFNYIIDTTGGAPVLTAAAVVNGTLVGRIPLFDLALPSLALPLVPSKKDILSIGNIAVTLSSDAAAALNSAFGVTAFSAGFPIGTARTTFKVGAK
jgi:hypothetical protein